MIKIQILLVEDEAPKSAHIKRFVEGMGPNIAIAEARSVNSALDNLENCRPNLLLLDMSLPTFDVGGRESGGRPQGFGGIEVLRHMMLAEIHCPTIVITGYEAFAREVGKPVELSELRAELSNEFPLIFKGLLHYNSTFDEWKKELRRVLAELGFAEGAESEDSDR